MTAAQPILAFLVYDGRSGSTFLAAQLNRLRGVSVSHESRFASTILENRAPVDDDAGVAKLTDRLFEETHFAELGFTPSAVRQVLCGVPVPRTKKALIEALVDTYFQARDPGARVRVLKSGRAAFHLDALARHFPAARVLHIVRDGRAVFMSKASTTSTRGRLFEDNVLAAALEWRRKCDRVKASKLPVTNVVYEALMADPEGVLDATGASLGLDAGERERTKSAQDWARAIGELQQSLHVKVGGAADRARIDDWRGRIDPACARAFDWVAGDTLALHGYAPFAPGGLRGSAGAAMRLAFSAMALGGRRMTRAFRHAAVDGSLASRIRQKLFALNFLRAR